MEDVAGKEFRCCFFRRGHLKRGTNDDCESNPYHPDCQIRAGWSHGRYPCYEQFFYLLKLRFENRDGLVFV